MSTLSDELEDILRDSNRGGGRGLSGRTLSSSSGGTFQDSDDFDAAALLSQPLFDEDHGGGLSLESDDPLPGMPPERVSTESGSDSSGGGRSNHQQQHHYQPHLGMSDNVPQPHYNDLQSQQQQQIMSGYGNNGAADPMSSMMMGQQQYSEQQPFEDAGPAVMDNFQGMSSMLPSQQQMMVPNDQMSNQMMMMMMMQQDQDHQQQQQFGNSFYQQQQSPNKMGNSMGGMNDSGMPSGGDEAQNQQQAAVNRRMMEVQHKIQQVQQRIQHVQLGAVSNTMGNPNMIENQNLQLQDMVQQQHQQGQISSSSPSPTNDPQGMMRQQQQQQMQQQMQQDREGFQQGNQGGGFRRSPPGRSISMPAQRMVRKSPVSPFSNSFVVQQQQQRQNALQAMSQSLNNYQNLQQQQHQLQPGLNQSSSGSGSGGGIDASTRSVPADLGSMQMAMMQQHANNNMQGTMPVGQPPLVTAGGGDPSISPMSSPMSSSMRKTSLTGQGGPPMRNNSMGSSSMQGQPGSAGFDLAVMAQSLRAGVAARGGEGQAANVNEAMEKLCESMRRSAMSRSLVKQLSSKTLQRNHSGRSLSGATPGRMAPVRSHSGRQLSRANSGKSLQRTHSGRAQSVLVQGTAGGPGGGVNPGMDSSMNSVGSEMMARRMSGMSISQNSKHRLTPTRGVFRHHSTTATMGTNKMSTLAAMQQVQRQMQQQPPPQQQQMDPSDFQMMDPAMMQQQQEQNQQLPNMMDNDFMSGGGF